jgi:hypothetical protein
MYRRMSVQSGNSVVLLWSVYEWIEMLKNGAKVLSIKEESEQQLKETVYTWLVSSQNFLF